MIVSHYVMMTGTVKDLLFLMVTNANLQLPRNHAPSTGAKTQNGTTRKAAEGHFRGKIKEIWILALRVVSPLADLGAVS